MTLSGLTGSPLEYKLPIPAYDILHDQRASVSFHAVKSVNFVPKQRYWHIND